MREPTGAAAPAGSLTVVGRGGVEPPTFHFSGGRSYQLSYLPSPVPGSLRRRRGTLPDAVRATKTAGWSGRRGTDRGHVRSPLTSPFELAGHEWATRPRHVEVLGRDESSQGVAPDCFRRGLGRRPGEPSALLNLGVERCDVDGLRHAGLLEPL